MKNYNNFIESDAVGYEISNFIYHVSSKKNSDKIRKNGFIPQDGTSISGEEFTNRVYFATSLISAYDISVNFSSYRDEYEYVIFKIDSSCISDYEKDKLFAHGIYVDYNVSSDYILDEFDADDLFDKFDEDDLENLYI